MNLPNKLTMLRVIMTPFFMAAMILPFRFHYIVALVLFAVASLTDYFDGKIARKRNLVTDFGKFVDPIADKMLTTAAFIGFLKIGRGVGMEWVLFIILFREFAVASLRMVAASGENKVVIPANIWGKLKTVTQMLTVIYGLLALSVVTVINVPSGLVTVLDVIFNCLVWVSAILTIISGVIYIKDGLKYIDNTK